MSTKAIIFAAAIAVVATPCAAQVAAYSDASSYTGYGVTAANFNQPVNASLRDQNGNLQVVNGQFQTSTMSQQSGVQNMSPLMGSSGVGFGHSSTGTATAIGNSLNVITAGSNNTVIVNSVQTNNGNQTATVNTNGH